MLTAGTTHPVRVQLVGLPGMLSSIIRDTLAQQPDMRVVDRYDRSEAQNERNADVILAPITLRHPLAQAREIATVPGHEPTVIGITPDGRHVVVFHSDLSPQDLVHTIRAAASAEEQRSPVAGASNL